MGVDAQSSPVESDASGIVADLIDRGRDAMAEISGYSQEEVDELVRAVGWAIYQEDHAVHLSEVAVEESGLGKVEDKTQKKRRKILGVLEDTLGEPSVGVIDVDEEQKLTEIAKPVGVVGAVVPSTHPGTTPTALAMMALKGRNAIILSPSPRGEKVCELVVEYIHDELEAVGAPTDLVQMVPRPASKSKAYELMDQVDLLQVTGSSANVARGESSGTPNYCVGEGNAVAIVDSTADVETVAKRLHKSKTVDHATSCSSDNNAAIVEDVYDDLVDALQNEGGYVCNETERRKIRDALFPEGHGSLDTDLVAQPADVIAEAAGLENSEAKAADFFVTEGTGIGPEYPLSGEKLAVVLNVFEVADLEEAIETTKQILSFEGAGHSCGIHTENDDHVRKVGDEVNVARVIVNQPHAFANGGWHKNGLPNTLSEGGGTWAGNQLDGNVNYEHFIQTTTISRVIEDAARPDERELFGSYLETHA